MTTLADALVIARQHHLSGRRDLAEPVYRQILARVPQHAEVWHLLGVALHQAGDHAAALEHITRAIALNGRVAIYHNSLGNAYAAAHRLDEALASYQTALQIEPRLAEAHNNLGAAWQARGDMAAATACYRQALRLKPDYADAHNNLGNVLKTAGDADGALAAYRRALELNPNFPAALSNLAGMLHDRDDIAAALDCYRRALELTPHVPEIHNNLGTICADLGQLAEAEACYRRALQLRPDYASAQSNLGVVLKDQGRLTEALACYRRAIELEPDHVVAHSDLLYTLHFCPEYDARAIANEHTAWNQRHAQPLAQAAAPHANDRTPDRRLRVGYVSPDFRLHPIGRFILPLLQAHDRDSVEAVCYSSVHVPDFVTERCRAAAHIWRDVAGTSDADLAQKIRADRIDILVDLTMHMAGGRLLAFARRPAPVQVTYLAYCGTTGLTAIDYRLTDPHLDPPGAAAGLYSEELVVLPETYWCYQPVDDTPPVRAEPPAARAGRVTFGCLNNFCKATDATLAVWCRVLQAAPQSRLLLHARPGGHRQRVVDLFTRHGLASDRLLFADPAPLADYFALYNQIDVALDPFPYGGGTTTCDALWMGVPVVSLVGATAVGRAGLSILSNVGLPELAARDVAAYVQIAVDLAGDPSRLAQLRTSLRQRMQSSPLTDAARFTRHVEAAYRNMWHRWCAPHSAT